ncbi:MAG: hypothetical protein AAF191_19400 [Verrucomicrobiota bacterium]
MSCLAQNDVQSIRLSANVIMSILTVILGGFLFCALATLMMGYAYLSGEARISEAEERAALERKRREG